MSKEFNEYDRTIAPCPFCESECGQVYKEPTMAFGHFHFWECEGCAARGPLAKNGRTAISRWNKRSRKAWR